MKPILALVGVAVLMSSGCKKEESHAVTPSETNVPSQEELDSKASQDIDASNADQEMQKLESEIEKDG